MGKGAFSHTRVTRVSPNEFAALSISFDACRSDPKEEFMGQTRRHTALGIMVVAAGVAVLCGEIGWRNARAQTIPGLDARVVAMNIPGASAIAQVGTFLSGPPTPFGQCTLPHPIDMVSFQSREVGENAM